MISFSDSVQADSSKWKICDPEEVFSDFSSRTSTAIANVNNNPSKQIIFFFSLSLFSRSRSSISILTPSFECNEVRYVKKLIHPLGSRSSTLLSLLFFSNSSTLVRFIHLNSNAQFLSHFSKIEQERERDGRRIEEWENKETFSCKQRERKNDKP